MRIVVLGSAAGGGFPQWNCRCDVCTRAWVGDPAAAPRTQCSLAVSADGERWHLLNASPDLRHQILATPEMRPRRGARDSPIAGVVLTNGDIDHVAGLLTLREGQPFAVHATRRILEVLAANRIFAALDPEVVTRREVPLGETFALGEGLAAEMFAVPGKVALYLEEGTPEIGALGEDTVGLRIAERGGAEFFFVPGCAALTDELARRLAGAPLVFFDGTLFRDDEMIRAGVGAKTGARMGHMSIDGPDGSLAALAGLGIERRVYVHLNNTNPVLLADSLERRTVEQAGWEVAYDGMAIEL